MLDPLPIQPFSRPARGEVALPGSKSITSRALLLAALCEGTVNLTNALFSEDTEIMVRALNALGIKVTADAAAKTMSVSGRGGRIPVESAELFVANAGTAARFLTALCAAAPHGVFRIDGGPQMRRRPMKGLIDVLRAQGARIACTGAEGFFPLTIEAHGLSGGEVKIDASESSQMLSALLMVAPMAQKKLGVSLLNTTVSIPFVTMTLRMMVEGFGQSPPFIIKATNTSFFPQRPYTRIGPYNIEIDATAASYFAVLPIVTGGELKINDVLLDDLALQGDFRFIRLLDESRLLAGVNWGLIPKPLRRGESRKGVAHDFKAVSDTFLTLAAIAPLLEGPTRITGIAHTRRQETDRVAGAARELRKLGQEVVEEVDALTITPRPLKADIEVETYDDHRFAMSFAILGCHDRWKNGQPWLRIKNPGCCAKTFPDFFTVLEAVRQRSLSA